IPSPERFAFQLGVFVIAGREACCLRDGSSDAEFLRSELAECGENRSDPSARFTNDRVQMLVELCAVLIRELRIDVVLAIVDGRNIAESQAVVLEQPEIAMVVVARDLREEQAAADSLKLLRRSRSDIGKSDRVEHRQFV